MLNDNVLNGVQEAAGSNPVTRTMPQTLFSLRRFLLRKTDERSILLPFATKYTGKPADAGFFVKSAPRLGGKTVTGMAVMNITGNSA